MAKDDQWSLSALRIGEISAEEVVQVVAYRMLPPPRLVAERGLLSGDAEPEPRADEALLDGGKQQSVRGGCVGPPQRPVQRPGVVPGQPGERGGRGGLDDPAEARGQAG